MTKQLIADTSANQLQGFVSHCDQVVLLSARQAQFEIQGQWLQADLTESRDADGGDLDDMLLRTANGTVVARWHDIPAFDQVVLGLLGGDSRELQTE